MSEPIEIEGPREGIEVSPDKIFRILLANVGWTLSRHAYEAECPPTLLLHNALKSLQNLKSEFVEKVTTNIDAVTGKSEVS